MSDYGPSDRGAKIGVMMLARIEKKKHESIKPSYRQFVNIQQAAEPGMKYIVIYLRLLFYPFFPVLMA